VRSFGFETGRNVIRIGNTLQALPITQHEDNYSADKLTYLCGGIFYERGAVVALS
jgi:hypothetical protein